MKWDPEDAVTDDQLEHLVNAHTGTDLECACWQAANEIRYLRNRVKELENDMEESKL